MDESDEMFPKPTVSCLHEIVNPHCDDHLCPPNHWSCNDGQCIAVRLMSRSEHATDGCANFRDLYYMCEIHPLLYLWTLPNGRCYEGIGFLRSDILNVSTIEPCELLLRCTLYGKNHTACPCVDASTCSSLLSETCTMSLIPYPHRPIIAPFLTLLYDRSRRPDDQFPSMIQINGTIRCQSASIYVNRTLPFSENITVRSIVHQLCANLNVIVASPCSQINGSTDICGESSACLSITRLNDGVANCNDRQDEQDRSKMEVEWSCARVRRHRLRCSAEQPTCLTVAMLSQLQSICPNTPSQLSPLAYEQISNCNQDGKSDCHHLRQLIERSWIDVDSSASMNKRRIPFRFYCDTFSDLDFAEDENVEECRRWWTCDRCQQPCGTKQCIPSSEWPGDTDWDCADGTDLEPFFRTFMESVKGQAMLVQPSVNQTYFLPATCHASSFFACFAAHLPHQPIICLDQNQLGDGKIDCAGAIDEANAIPHCSQPSMLGKTYRCLSTNTCIPFGHHCREGYRCPNRTDDERWCSSKWERADNPHLDAIQCSDGEFVLDMRCDLSSDCSLGEDEYMCDFQYAATGEMPIFRKKKRIGRQSLTKVFRLPRFPSTANVIVPHQSINQTPTQPSTHHYGPSSLAQRVVVFRCNRGIGVWSANRSSVFCFCSPHYYGDKCQYHADRLIVLLHVNLSKSIYSTRTDPTILLKFNVFLLFHNQTLRRHEFEVRPAFELHTVKKRMIYFPYSHTNNSHAQRQQRLQNRSDLLSSQPYSVRIEAHETNFVKRPALVAVWQYSVEFDYLPVYRIARILHWPRFNHLRNPCLSDPCRPNGQCQQVMNDPTNYVCVCKTNFTGRQCLEKAETCISGFCSSNSLCKSDPSPYCICPANRFGPRCDLEHDSCESQPCFNGGSCFPSAQLDEVFCWCHHEYYGPRCEWKKASIRLSIDGNGSYHGVVIQFFDYHPVSLDLLLIHQRVYSFLPPLIEYHREKETIPSIVVAKIYSSYDDDQPELYLLSLNDNVASIDGRTKLSERSRCMLIESVSPIQYHRICQNLTDSVCFHDDIYLCLCVDDQTRAECFLYDHELDQCDHCLTDGRCLQGDRTESKDFLCLCPPCYSGEQCQFSSKSFTFTLDQLLYTDLVAKDKQRATVSLSLFFSILIFLLAIPNNLFTFATFCRKPCRRNGIGYYLFTLSIINQIHLGLFLARLIHIIRNIATTSSASVIDGIFCKLLNYLLLSSGRLVFWLSSLVAIERLYTTLVLNGRWLKQPRIALRLIIVVSLVVLLSSMYELFFYKSLFIASSTHRWICMFDFPTLHQSFWIIYHLLISSFHSLLPFLINLCATIIISVVVVKKKMNTLQTKHTVRFVVNVLREHKELVIGPGITLIPQLFSLPLVIFSFSLNCQNIENSWLRYLLIASYWTSLIPQLISFFLYIGPSSFYLSEWRKTEMAQSMRRLWSRRPATRPMNFTVLPVLHRMNKGTA